MNTNFLRARPQFEIYLRYLRCILATLNTAWILTGIIKLGNANFTYSACPEANPMTPASCLSYAECWEVLELLHNWWSQLHRVIYIDAE
jgi:hypothetical protein